MELHESIKVIREFQAWRRGGDDPMPYPRTTGQALDAICHHAERMEAEIAVWKHESKRLDEQLNREAIELEQERQDRKQADLDCLRAIGERNDARAEIEQIKATLANPHAVHINMLRGTIQWTPANLRHLLGNSTDDLADQSEIDLELDACVERSARDWRPLPGDPDEPGDANRLQTETDDQAGDTA